MWNIVLPTVLRMSFTGSIVILVVLAARLLLRRAPKIFSYLLWGVVLLRLLCPVSFPTHLSVMQFVEFPEENGKEAASPAADDKGNINLKSLVAYGLEKLTPQQDVPSQTSHAKAAGYVPKPAISSQSSPENPEETLFYWGTIAWLAGTISILIYSAISLLRFRRKLVGAVRLKDNIYLTDYIPSAFVFGLFKPKIYLPTTLSETEQEYIILHEQVHIRRRDYLMKALSLAALALHWFNPLVWLAFRLSERDMEMSCDEAVMKKIGRDIRAEYSASLLKLATGKRILSGTLPAFGEGETGNRIKHILHYKKPTIAVIAAAAAIMGATVVFAGSEPKKDTGNVPAGSPPAATARKDNTVSKNNFYTNGLYSLSLPANCTIEEGKSDAFIVYENKKIAMITTDDNFLYGNTTESIVANWIGMRAGIKSESQLTTDKGGTFHKVLIETELSAAQTIKGEAPEPDKTHYFLTEGKFFIDILVYDNEYSTLLENIIKSFTLQKADAETPKKDNGSNGKPAAGKASAQDSGKDSQAYDAEAIRKSIPNFDKYAHSVPPVECKKGQSWMESVGLDKSFETTMECAYLRFMSEDTVEVDPVEFITKDSDPKRRKELGITLEYLHQMDGYYLHNPDDSTQTWKLDENTEFIFLDWGRDFINVDNYPGMTIKTTDRELFRCYISTYADSKPGMPFFFEVEDGVVKRVVERFFA